MSRAWEWVEKRGVGLWKRAAVPDLSHDCVLPVLLLSRFWTAPIRFEPAIAWGIAYPADELPPVVSYLSLLVLRQNLGPPISLREGRDPIPASGEVEAVFYIYYI